MSIHITLRSLIAQAKNCSGDKCHRVRCKRCRRGREVSLRRTGEGES
ncbi:hypothetical protein SEA_GUDMIT_43 [Gordonia phage Gudmit]|nr:hypothetical protein SEA_GUDMIT_43 [Gordonia phage Gudmit]